MNANNRVPQVRAKIRIANCPKIGLYKTVTECLEVSIFPLKFDFHCSDWFCRWFDFKTKTGISFFSKFFKRGIKNFWEKILAHWLNFPFSCKISIWQCDTRGGGGRKGDEGGGRGGRRGRGGLKEYFLAKEEETRPKGLRRRA